MHNCNKCKEFGLEFNRHYKPNQFIEGKLSSKIWIIGIQPAVDVGWTDEERKAKDLAGYFNDIEDIHRYFKDFERVSPRLFKMFGKAQGVASTDLVKCSSKKWPPENCKGKQATQIINNCKPYLFEQIAKYKPKMIICNGAPTSHKVQEVLEVDDWLSETAYESTIEGAKVIVVLSGFIGRLDNFSRRRLGYEIESLIDRI